MRFKQRKSQVPEVNLVPMLDVLMTVLTFFIIVSMTLALEQGVQVDLPNNPDQANIPATELPPVLRVNLHQSGVLLNGRPVSQAQLEPQIRAFLQQNAKGIVVLQSEPAVPYEQVVQLLDQLKAIAGNRVSLAID